MPMNSENVGKLQHKLLFWYKHNHRDLPWRNTKDFYSVWVAEVMLQQTQVNTVVDYYLRFMREFPNLESLAAANLQHVLGIWQGMGYYQRAQNLHKASKVLLHKFAGKPPDKMSDFKKLPGVGEYIAAAVYSFCFGMPEPVVDGNVKRVVSRIFCIEEAVNTSAGIKKIKQHVRTIFHRSKPAEFNQAIMELGALICKPKNPNCSACPISEFCLSFKNSLQYKFPVKIAKRTIPTVNVSIALIRNGGKILLVRRSPYGLLAGMWELPGGKINESEKPQMACARQLKEKFDLQVLTKNYLFQITHTYSHFKIKGFVFECSARAQKLRLRDHDDYAWFDIEEIERIPIHAAHLKILRKLQAK